MYHQAVRLVLASRSPRRAQLLAAAGFDFEISPADVNEARLKDESPETYVTRLANAKATSVTGRYPNCVVVGADTLVVAKNQILGKPTDNQDAVKMLRQLSGRTHEVLTAVTVLRDAQRASVIGSTRVTFIELSDQGVAAYVASGEPIDMAGAYAIQGLASRFVESIEGSYTNVVGLPIVLLIRLLSQVGISQDL